MAFMLTTRNLRPKGIPVRIGGAALTAAAMLFCLTPSSAAQPAAPDTHVAAAPTSQRDTYMLNSETELDGWQVKLLRFCDEAKLHARKDKVETEADLLAALDKAEARASRLQTVGAEGWDDARISYEKATSELGAAWDKVQPGDRR